MLLEAFCVPSGASLGLHSEGQLLHNFAKRRGRVGSGSGKGRERVGRGFRVGFRDARENGRGNGFGSGFGVGFRVARGAHGKTGQNYALAFLAPLF